MNQKWELISNEEKPTMTEYELKAPGNPLSSLLGEKDGLAGLVEVHKFRLDLTVTDF